MAELRLIDTHSRTSILSIDCLSIATYNTNNFPGLLAGLAGRDIIVGMHDDERATMEGGPRCLRSVWNNRLERTLAGAGDIYEFNTGFCVPHKDNGIQR